VAPMPRKSDRVLRWRRAPKISRMKTKQSTKVQTGLPLPEPMELAKLAAILQPDSASTTAALEKAMEFYVEAVLFSRELPSTLEELVTQFGSEERWLALAAEPFKKRRRELWADFLELDPEKDTDAVRDFLSKRGLQLKTKTGVLDNIRDAWNARPKNTLSAGFRQSADAIVAQCKKTSNGRTIYNIPRFLLEDTAEYAKRRSRARKRKSWDLKRPQKAVQEKAASKN
jgi:hypothetical protein